MVSSGRISVSGVASIFGGRPVFASAALTFFSGVGRPVFVSVSRSSLVVTAASYRVFPIMVLIYGSCGLLGPIDSPSSVEAASPSSLFRIPFWLDGFFSVSSEFLPVASVLSEEDSSSCLDACPVVAGQPNTWWTV
ncbi:hypothetical protein Bca101_005533 [Brassica carinata]